MRTALELVRASGRVGSAALKKRGVKDQAAWNRSTRPRWCARRQAQVREDPCDPSRIFDGGDDLQARATVRAVFDIDVKDPLEQTRPTQACRRAGRVLCGMIACTVRPMSETRDRHNSSVTLAYP
jgi:hypothetical protein